MRQQVFVPTESDSGCFRRKILSVSDWIRHLVFSIRIVPLRLIIRW